ncbi:clathrin light chain [Sporodiniella umbellata]|nr:clathrin light chain [Sporodiniella umbellata]
MSDFGDFNTPSEDPTADFLARERAALGEDADFFSGETLQSPAVNDLLSPTALPMSPSLFEEAPIQPSVDSQAVVQSEYPSFEASFPKAEELESSQAFHKALLPEEEPETVRQWREKQKEIIAERDATSAKAKEERINKAREEIDKFYEDYNDKKQRYIEENRAREETTEKSREQVSSSSNVWERVLSEIDIKSAKTGYHTNDVSRMKDLMLDLRKDSSAPGNIVA